MTEKKNQKKGLIERLSSLWRRERSNHLEISGYHVGDLESERPVHIAPGSAVAGNIAAPQVIVAGLVYGFLTTRELIVLEGGQVWGDVFAAAAQVHPAAKMNGWLSTFDEGTLDLIRSGELGVTDGPAAQRVELPPALVQRVHDLEREYLLQVDERSQPWLSVFRRLSLEAATAMLARQELESTLDAPTGTPPVTPEEQPVSQATGASADEIATEPATADPAGDAEDARRWVDAGLAAAEAQLAQTREALAGVAAAPGETRLVAPDSGLAQHLAEVEDRLADREKELASVRVELAETKRFVGRVISAASAKVERLERELAAVKRGPG
jgi:cytoskeletal protein CcmA (bactofilin family)